MNDERIWQFEQSLWQAGEDEYLSKIAEKALPVVPAEPCVMEGADAAQAMAETPRWNSVEFSQKKVVRPDGPEGGLIVIAYRASATRDDDKYNAWCTSTYLRHGHEDWVVVQHQQTPDLIKS